MTIPFVKMVSTLLKIPMKQNIMGGVPGSEKNSVVLSYKHNWLFYKQIMVSSK
jgi:hypothetical protein